MNNERYFSNVSSNSLEKFYAFYLQICAGANGDYLNENQIPNFNGRLEFDLSSVLKQEYKLRSYSLDAVSYHFLNEHKEYVDRNDVIDLQYGNDETRRRLAVYCIENAQLSLKLMNNLHCFVNCMEMSRVAGVPFKRLLKSGTKTKVASRLLRKAKSLGYLMPVCAEEKQYQCEGSMIIDPKRGFYADPIVTLDFASYYPSIAIAYNLCYTTLLLSSPKGMQR